MPDEHEHRRRWPWVLFLLVALLLIGTFGVYWVWSTGGERRLAHQVALYKAAGEPIELADFNVVGVSDEDNAVIDLRAAATSIDESTDHYKAFMQIDAALPLTAKEADTIKAFASDNAAAFKSVDLAMTKKGIDWKIPFRSPAISILLPDLNKQRQLSTLIQHDALAAHESGNDRQTMRDLRRIWFIGNAVDHQPVLISHLVATGIRSLAADLAQKTAPDLKIGSGPIDVPPAEIKAIIAMLLDEKESRAAYQRSLLGERAFELDAARCVADGRLSLSTITASAPVRGNPLAMVGDVAARPMALADGLIMIRHTTAFRDATAKAQDWQSFQAIVPPPPPEVMGSPYRHMVARVMMPSFDRSMQTEFRMSFARRTGAIALATALYRADHDGKFPAKLEDLVPTYLPALPADPMVTGGTLKYVAATTQPIVYSIGDDGIDQGGSEVSNSRHAVNSEWDMQDVVIHLTRQPRRLPNGADDQLSGVDAEGLNLATTQATTAPAAAPDAAPATMPSQK